MKRTKNVNNINETRQAIKEAQKYIALKNSNKTNQAK